jgi:hypothetical protein
MSKPIVFVLLRLLSDHDLNYAAFVPGAQTLLDEAQRHVMLVAEQVCCIAATATLVSIEVFASTGQDRFELSMRASSAASS